jgi:hypothetical protein
MQSIFQGLESYHDFTTYLLFWKPWGVWIQQKSTPLNFGFAHHLVFKLQFGNATIANQAVAKKMVMHT